jgi:uncharacterized PurR-regulated membrane protein YhhQ (DUF165 family)
MGQSTNNLIFMYETETIAISDINRKALISFLAAALALLTLCMGLLPIPFTMIICYPPGIVLGGVSLTYGVIALREIRNSGKRGRRLALAAIWAGGFMLLVAICMIAVSILLYPYISEFVQQIWQQINSR